MVLGTMNRRRHVVTFAIRGDNDCGIGGTFINASLGFSIFAV